LVAVLLALTRHWENRWIGLRVFLIGLLVGLMTTVRFHNALFLLVPAVMVLRPDGLRTKLRNIFLLGAGSLIGFSPQIAVWHVMYGTWIVNMGGAFLRKPMVLETLFSARKGLFPWSPVLVLSLCGIFLLRHKERKWGWSLLLVLLFTICLNSSQVDWWGSASFGARRFVPCTAIFALGLAALYTVAAERFKGYGRLMILALVLLFVHMNLFLTDAFRRGQLQAEHADRFSDVFQGGFASVYNYVTYPLEFPVQLYYHLRYGIRLYHPLNEFFIGEDILYFQKRAGFLIAGLENTKAR